MQVLTADEYPVRLPELRGFALGRRMATLFPPPAPQPPRAAREVLDRLRAGLRGGIHLIRLDGTVHAVVDEDPDFPLAPEPGVRKVVDVLCAELADGAAPVGQTYPWSAVGVTVVEEAGQVVAGLLVIGLDVRLPDVAELEARLTLAATGLGPLLA